MTGLQIINIFSSFIQARQDVPRDYFIFPSCLLDARQNNKVSIIFRKAIMVQNTVKPVLSGHARKGQKVAA